MTQTKIGKDDSEIIPEAIRRIRRALDQIPGMEGQDIIIEHGGKYHLGSMANSHGFLIYKDGVEIGECVINWYNWKRLAFGEGVFIKPEQIKLKKKAA